MKLSRPKIGFLLGDHAGIGPEIVAKSLSINHRGYTPVVIGNCDIFRRALHLYAPDMLPCLDNETGIGNQSITVIDIPKGGDVVDGEISLASGELQYKSIIKGIHLLKQKKINGLILAPLTKQSMHKAGLNYQSEVDILEKEFQQSGIRGVVKAGSIFRCSVVGHYAFKKIIQKLTVETVVETGRQLIEIMAKFGQSDRGIAVAALNPHAGEGGLFGDEETTILKPAIEQLKQYGVKVLGPSPADTVFLKAKSNEVGGIVYLYHDQGNIAMKSACFSEAVVIYTKIPQPIVTVGHGSALDIAWSGIADPSNMCKCIDEICELINYCEESVDE